MNRAGSLCEAVDGRYFDIVVIGGGATGLGVAVDAAARGFRALLLEAEDFAKGTSSRSTKLVHGGVRYLEQGDIPLVLEALHERGLLHRNAPHLVHNQSFVVPRYRWWEGPFFGAGLKFYDLLAGKLNLSPSRLLDRATTIQRIPNIEQDALLGGVEYFDGQFDDARLAITLARTAASLGACLLNYCPVVALEKDGGRITGVAFRDTETGSMHQVRARCVINATGIFADSIRKLEDPEAVPTVQPSQGVHLVFDRSFLRGDSAIMVPHTDDGRVLFVIPWLGRVLVGTTDTAMEAPEIEPRARREEIGFILRNAARYLAHDPREEDILSIFAGQRPLVRRPGRDGAATKSVSRNHEIFVSPSGLVTIVGGKWTTYRKMAADTLDKAIEVSGLAAAKSWTDSMELFGAAPCDSLPAGLEAYGSEAAELVTLMEAEPSLAAPIHPRLPYPMACIAWAARQEMARTLEDALARRTRCLLLDAAATMEAAPRVAYLLAAETGRNESWARHQIDSFSQIASGYLGRGNSLLSADSGWGKPAILG
ncbi:MAG: glycerol-3-phosphate dehydrogenase/oxidase [Terrimicrobiaceae bacterium]